MPRTKLNDSQVRDPEFALQPELDVMTLKSVVYRNQVYGRVTVPAGQNYVALTGTSKPSGLIATGTSALGTLCAKLSTAIGANYLTTLSGSLNICLLRSYSGQEEIFAGGAKVYGLLQVGSSAVDGSAFADSGANQAQLSFVYMDPATRTFAACPATLIAGTDLEFLYFVRGQEVSKPENSLSFPEFIDDGVFGRVPHDSESLAESSSSGTTFLTKTSITVNVLKAGRYRLGWGYFFRVSNNTIPYYTQVLLDSATADAPAAVFLSSTSTSSDAPSSGFFYCNLSAGSHTIELQYRSSSTTRYLYISNARLEFWRSS